MNIPQAWFDRMFGSAEPFEAWLTTSRRSGSMVTAGIHLCPLARYAAETYPQDVPVTVHADDTVRVNYAGGQVVFALPPWAQALRMRLDAGGTRRIARSDVLAAYEEQRKEALQ